MQMLTALTSHDTQGETGKKNRRWLEELAAPYYVFLDEGFRMTLASPRGGQPPLAPINDAPEAQANDSARFHADEKARDVLANMQALSALQAQNYDAIFYPGGHNPLWDVAQNVYAS